MNRKEIIDLVENKYFGQVAAGDIGNVMSCFTADAGVTIRHGDNPVREFHPSGKGGKTNLRQFYEHLCGNYDAWFGDFVHFVDAENNRSACTFTVKLKPKPDSQYIGKGTQVLQNCNFFFYEDAVISGMTIYYSNSAAGVAEAGQRTPTGYPPAGWQAR